MISKVSNEEGFFTLIEGIIVLIIVAIIIGLPSVKLSKLNTQIDSDIFINQLASEITLLQQNAILNGEMTVLEVEPSQNQFRLSVMQNKHSSLNKTMKVPKDMKLYGGYKRFSFRPYSGNITQVDRIRLSNASKTYEIVFQIGSGRFYVREV